MGDYTNMAGYYDLIMTSGYYDYDQIVSQLMQKANFRRVLEIGCGTGLIIEALAKRRPDVEIAGIDLTQAMQHILRGNGSWDVSHDGALQWLECVVNLQGGMEVVLVSGIDQFAIGVGCDVGGHSDKTGCAN